MIPVTISIIWSSFITKWFTIQNIYSRTHYTLCANTYHDVTTFKNNWIHQGRNRTFPWNKKAVKLCLKDCIFRLYNFLVETTYKDNFAKHWNSRRPLKRKFFRDLLKNTREWPLPNMYFLNLFIYLFTDSDPKILYNFYVKTFST